jgi:hypothetical protein
MPASYTAYVEWDPEARLYVGTVPDSHNFYRHPDGRTTTLPNHGGRDLAKPLIREVLRELEITPARFRELL